jgi:hypothetical protein
MRAYVTASGFEADRLALRWFYQASHAAVQVQRASGLSSSNNGAVAGQAAMSDEPPREDHESKQKWHPVTKVPAFRSDVPPLASNDQGGADWERDLVKAVRTRGFLWRTEETYRSWAARFARFLHPRSPYAATGDDVGAFLTELAVKQRAMPSTQKQALNALVFLLQEALNRQLGTVPFQRAAPRRRMPTVLTKEECTRLFAELKGTTRLMAELMYGSGLRLMELLRLRVHHVDLGRHQLKICGAKGDKDRITVLSAQLDLRLREHIERLRALHMEDRASGLPGVWLPEGLARSLDVPVKNGSGSGCFPPVKPAKIRSHTRGDAIMSSTARFRIASVVRGRPPVSTNV